jgi:hypothetical protein
MTPSGLQVGVRGRFIFERGEPCSLDLCRVDHKAAFHFPPAALEPLETFVGKRRQSPHLAPKSVHLILHVHVVLSQNEERFGFLAQCRALAENLLLLLRGPPEPPLKSV